MDKTIWFFWSQGLDNAPEIVKTCIKSIKTNSNGYNVVIFSEENFKNFVNIPQWIDDKKEGIITKTNYSDLLRLSLLAEHCGMWLDSTLLATSKLSNEYFDLPT